MSDALCDAGPILLTGGTGQVGGQLLSSLAPYGRVVAPSHHELDLSRPDSCRHFIRALRPRWIVNAAAYTAVDLAESQSKLAYVVNGESVGVIGDEAGKIGAVVIHFSTDYVFSGAGATPYLETELPDPISVYGCSKLAGEKALAASGAASLIFRTSWVYGAAGKNFLLTILKLARQRETLRIVADQHGAPTASHDLARLIAMVVKRVEEESSSAGKPLAEAASAVSGIYHATGAGETTWHGFASEAIRQMREREPETMFANLEAIATTEYPTPAKRPLNSRLNCGKLAATFGCRMPAWPRSLSAVLAELTGGRILPALASRP